jgi:two-component system sensor histidine kinase/response regulator
VEQGDTDQACVWTGQAVVIKPVSRRQLLEVVNVTLGGAPEERAAGRGLRWTGRREPPAFLRGRRILLVEDNRVNQMVARGLLEQAGVEVTIADDGLRALALVEPGRFDAVLMDIEMPGMDGYETTARIREFLADGALPIIAMTAHAFDDDRRRILAAGMNDHVPKPTDPWVLFSTLERWLGPRPDAEAHGPEAPVSRGLDAGVARAAGSLVLPGIDVAAGLERFLDDRELYLEVLVNFRDLHTDQVRRIRMALEAGDRNGARQLAHTVRGVAANVSADGVREAATALELALDQGALDSCEALLAALDRELALAMSGLAGLKTS